MNASQCLIGFLIALALATPTLAVPYEPPALHGMVEDPGHVLTAEQQAQLGSRLDDVRKQSGFAVVVFFPVSLEDQTVEDVAFQTFNRWKLGEAGKDNGVLLVLAVRERRVRIETGKGVGGQLTDIASGRILREQVIPRMKENRPYEAAVAGTDAIVAALRTSVHVGPPRDYQPTRLERIKTWVTALIGPVLALLVFLASVLLYRASRRGSGGGGGTGSGGSSGGWEGGSSGGGGYSGGGGSSGGGGASGSY